MELYIGNLNHVEIKAEHGLHGTPQKNSTTCVCFFAKSDEEAINNAKRLGLDSFGKITNVKIKGRDF
jgi:hypothetical protein